MKNYLKFAAIVIIIAVYSRWAGYRHGYRNGRIDQIRETMSELPTPSPMPASLETNITERVYAIPPGATSIVVTMGPSGGGGR